MKKLIVLVAITLSLVGCQLDPDKTWIIVSKDRYTDYQKDFCICSFKLSDGVNEEYFDDSCTALNVGDTVHGKKTHNIALNDTLK